jgi:hypothetical protein
MKRLALVAILAVLLLLPGVALAGSATDAALGLGAFAVFNQIISGTGTFGGVPAVAAPVPVVVAPPAPVYYAPQPVYVPPPPVAYYPAPPVYRAPRVIYVEREKHWNKHGRGRGHDGGHWRH